MPLKRFSWAAFFFSAARLRDGDEAADELAPARLYNPQQNAAQAAFPRSGRAFFRAATTNHSSRSSAAGQRGICAELL